MSDKQIRLSRTLSLPLEAVTETFAVIGNRGSGKSGTVTTFVEQLHKAGQQAVVLDVKGDYWGLRSSRDGKGSGLPFVIFGGEHGDVPLEPTAGAVIADAVVDYRLAAVIDLSLMSKTKARSFATAFAERLYLRNRDPIMLVVEEADVLIPQRADADTARLLGAMEDIAKRGRHRGLGLTIATQRGQEVNKSVLDLMETVILLRMTGRLTIKAVKDWISVNADEDSTSARVVIGSLPSLATGEAWVWSPAFLADVQRIKVTLFSTFDSHATPKPGERRIVPTKRVEVDLAKLGAEIVASVERAKATDPKALRDRLVALERLADERAREVERLRAALAEVADAEPETVEVKVAVEVPADLPAHIPYAMHQVVKGLEDALAEANNALKLMDEHRAKNEARTADAPPFDIPVVRPWRNQRTAAGIAAAASAPPAAPTRPQARHTTPNAGFAGPGLAVPKAQRAVLSALAPYDPRPRSKRQVAMLTGYSGKGGGFNNALSALRTAGFISGTGDAIGITTEGIAALGEYTPLPTGQALLNHWLDQLARAPRLILESLAGAWPEALSKDEVAARCDYEPAGGGFNNALSRLRTLELITGSGAALRAADDLMDQS